MPPRRETEQILKEKFGLSDEQIESLRSNLRSLSQTVVRQYLSGKQENSIVDETTQTKGKGKGK